PRPPRTPQTDAVPGPDESGQHALARGWRRGRRSRGRAGADRERAVHEVLVRVALEPVRARGEVDRPRHGPAPRDLRGLIDTGPGQVEVVRGTLVVDLDRVRALLELGHGR